jgi:hypothetical protein
MAKKTYLQENWEYSQRRWSEWMGAQLSRRFVIKAGTLAALGGASAMSQLMAACAGGSSQSTIGGQELAEGAFKYSRFPMVEKFNWRLVKWDMTPYYGGTFIDDWTPPNTWDNLRNSPTTKGGRFWQTLLRPTTDRPQRPDGPYRHGHETLMGLLGGA